MNEHHRTDEALFPATKGRSAFRLAALGAATVLLGSLLAPGSARAGGHAEALLLSCMDYRLIDEVERYMSGRHLQDKYDHIVLAGAALGAVTDRYPAWNKTFWEHLDIAINLHSIQRVIILDHRDCGAYKVILGEDFAKDPTKERDVHAARLRELGDLIEKRQPKLDVELLLMSLDGSVEAVAGTE